MRIFRWNRLVLRARVLSPAQTMAPNTNDSNATTSVPVVLTKEYIHQAFKHLEETQDMAHRNEFFTQYMLEDVKWEITGNGHSLAGTRYSLADHSAASFNRLGENKPGHADFLVHREQRACTDICGRIPPAQERSLPVPSSSSCGASSSSLIQGTLVLRRKVLLPGPMVRLSCGCLNGRVIWA